MTIPVDGLSELVLEVADLDAAERFYSGALGFPVVERYASGEAIWVMAGEDTRIGLWLPQLGVAGGRGGAHVHFALRIDERDFDGAVTRLREWGLEPQIESRRRHRSTANRSAYVFDPDGNCVDSGRRTCRSTCRGWPPGPRRRRRPPTLTPAPPSGNAIHGGINRPFELTLRGPRLEATTRLVGEGPGAVLHVEAGSGRLLAALVGRGWAVTGIDPRPDLIELARALVPEAAERLSVGSAEALPFPDHSFDVVVVSGALRTDDGQRPAEELARVLRGGGRIVLALRNNRAPAVVWRFGVVYPLARGVKRVVPFGRRPPKREPWPPSSERLREASR